MIFALSMAAVILAVTWALAAAPAIAVLPLGVSVPHDKRAEPAVTDAIKHYRCLVWAIGIAATLISVATWKWPTIAALPSLIVIFGALFAYVKSRRRIIEAKAAGGWYDDVETAISAQITATPLNNSALADLTAQVRFPWIWVLGSLLITAASAGIVAQGWDTIPETIPTHWGASMQPDAWSDKGIGTVFGLTFVNLGMIAVFALIFLVRLHLIGPFTFGPLHQGSAAKPRGNGRNKPGNRLLTLCNLPTHVADSGCLRIASLRRLAACGIHRRYRHEPGRGHRPHHDDPARTNAHR
ncbi:DUF1648 domain-containing protein [Corynebacterium striatum]|uniref:DUF1648 domain-containing protein n=1 Tax=Corynebacterium striatum TaxID=43770 RepID=UPI00254C4776|nr:DUF1648 domain-containing protein [Corynebacterium striatum]MDK8877620.1 DUF1648 domain-containing protein [Corynebacterium striatum]